MSFEEMVFFHAECSVAVVGIVIRITEIRVMQDSLVRTAPEQHAPPESRIGEVQRQHVTDPVPPQIGLDVSDFKDRVLRARMPDRAGIVDHQDAAVYRRRIERELVEPDCGADRQHRQRQPHVLRQRRL